MPETKDYDFTGCVNVNIKAVCTRDVIGCVRQRKEGGYETNPSGRPRH